MMNSASKRTNGAASSAMMMRIVVLDEPFAFRDAALWSALFRSDVRSASNSIGSAFDGTRFSTVTTCTAFAICPATPYLRTLSEKPL